MGAMNQAELKELLSYEVFLLMEAYGIIRQPLSKQYTEILEYPYDGSVPTRSSHSYILMKTGDWRPGFLHAGGPLIFASSFKILDLIVEWVLGDDARTAKGGALQFKEKVKRIHESSLTWPDFFRDQLSIRERFVALYEGLFPYRNTIIHAARFSSTGGGLKVAPSEGKGVFGDPVNIDSRMVSHIANAAVLLAKILEGAWEFDRYTSHRLRWSLNMLCNFHKLPLDEYLKPPSLALVRIHREDALFIRFDVKKIASELNRPMIVLTEEHGGVDVRLNYALFDLEVIVRGVSAQMGEYLIPFTSIDMFQDGISLKRLAEFEVAQTAATHRLPDSPDSS